MKPLYAVEKFEYLKISLFNALIDRFFSFWRNQSWHEPRSCAFRRPHHVIFTHGHDRISRLKEVRYIFSQEKLTFSSDRTETSTFPRAFATNSRTSPIISVNFQLRISALRQRTNNRPTRNFLIITGPCRFHDRGECTCQCVSLNDAMVFVRSATRKL